MMTKMSPSKLLRTGAQAVVVSVRLTSRKSNPPSVDCEMGEADTYGKL